GTATVAFVSELGTASEPWLVYDEHNHYLGSLTGRSRFEATIEPGEHTFGAAPFLSNRVGCVSVSGTFDAGSHHEARLVATEKKGEAGQAVVTAGTLEQVGGQRFVSALGPARMCPAAGKLASFTLSQP